MSDSEANLDKFLNKIDEIESIVKGLTSSEDGQAKEAMQKADCFMQENAASLPKKRTPAIDHTGVNRTSINQKALDNDSPARGPPLQQDMDQASFMAVMEQDARERAERRRQREAEATALKDKGNQAFKEEQYDKAVQLYTEALGKVKDMTALWTNRAQAYNRLGEYEKAISDCDWALRVFENCLKAFVLKGKAYLGLCQYDQALDCYREALRVDPKKDKLIQGYMAEVELARSSAEQERAAGELFDAGDAEAQGLVELLDRVNRDSQLPLYYSGGLRVIQQVLTGTSERTLFRTHAGLALTAEHSLIAKCFSASPRSLSREQLELCAVTIETLQVACISNEENQKQVLDAVALPEQMMRFLESKLKHCKPVKLATLSLLFTASQTPSGRSKVVARMNAPRLLSCIFVLIQGQSSIAAKAVDLMNNLALDPKFKTQLRDDIESSVLPGFEALMTDSSRNATVLPSCISTVTNLCGDAVIRRKLVQRKACWDACCKTLENNMNQSSHDSSGTVLHAVLGLLLNLSLERSQTAAGYALRVCERCLPLLSSTDAASQERGCALIGHLLPQSTEAVNHLCQAGIIPLLITLLKGTCQKVQSLSMKCTVSCTQSNTSARHALVESDGGLKAVYTLLRVEDEQVVGNAALCLGHLVATVPKVSATLTKTNVIQDLLVRTRDSSQMDVRQNCGILVAKLTQSDPRHLERLRELHGLEILHDIMKYLK